MTKSRPPFDWSRWHQQFGLPVTELAYLDRLYPEILAQMRYGGLETDSPLIDRVVHALVAENVPKVSLTALIDSFLDRGELGAATELIAELEKDDEMQAVALQRRSFERQQALELEINRMRAQVERYHSIMVDSGALGIDDPWLDPRARRAKGLEHVKRLGPAIRQLFDYTIDMQQQVDRQLQQLEAELQSLKDSIPSNIPRDVQDVLRTLQEKAEVYCDQRRFGAAKNAIHQAKIVLETRDTSRYASEVVPSQKRLQRDRFPDVRAREIREYLENPREKAESRGLLLFLNDWCPYDWRSGKPSRQDDQSFPVFEAISDLARLGSQGAPFPFSGMSKDPWRFFLKDLFDLIGKRGMEPQSAKRLLTRSVSQTTHLGFWLAQCKEAPSIPQTFIDPGRLKDGLSVILWHRSRDPLCPKPASLQNELQTQGIQKGPLLVLAAEPIASEERHELHRAIPTAALLDEFDLLRIFLCSEDPQERAKEFARSLAWQLPADIASPFRESGDVTGAMFVGRQDILREFSDPSGPTILYGGRKLGKSSIFRQLQRQFESQEGRSGHNIAIYVNAISVVDDSGIERTLLPEIVRDLNKKLRAFATAKEVNPLHVQMPTTDTVKCDVFAQHVRNVLHALPDHRILILVDEADSLVSYLAKPNDSSFGHAERFGWTLRGLVQESNGRFDIRFAGFQEISRSADITAGPFYNFRRGVAVRALKVLDRHEARELVENPLQLLGVDFEDDSLVDFILDLTGQHPALIQEFCGKLYTTTNRTGGRKEHFIVTRSDVEAISQNPEFRKSVVRAIYLNVETRHTKPEKILRLLLLLWVRQIMAPDEQPAIPIVCEPADLYRLLCSSFGKEAVQQHTSTAELDVYLSDLETLGVLERHGRQYAFRYRDFASMLYYDRYGGQLNKREIENLWQQVVSHRDEPPRLHFRTSNGDLALSPLSRRDQDNLTLNHLQLTFLLGAPGTGKSEFFRDLQVSQERQKDNSSAVSVIALENDRLDDLQAGLAAALKLPLPSRTWQELFDQAVRHSGKSKRDVLVVFDNIDHLANADSWPLLFWPSEDKTSEDDGLVGLLTRLTKETSGRLRFVFGGAYPLARLWVECGDLLDTKAFTVSVQPLDQQEMNAWFNTVRLVAPQEVKDSIWRLSNGDWRILRSVNTWSRGKKLEELEERHVQQIQAELARGRQSQVFSELAETLKSYDQSALETLRCLAEVSKQVSEEASAKDWAEFLEDHYRRSDRHELASRTYDSWFRDLQAAILLNELRTPSYDASGVAKFAIPGEDPWFRMLVGPND